VVELIISTSSFIQHVVAAVSVWFEIWGSWFRLKNLFVQAIVSQIILFFSKSHHLGTCFHCRLLYIIRYNNI